MRTFIYLLLCVFCAAARTYDHSKLLTKGYILSWTTDIELEEIYFSVEVKTSGWVGFGISVSGGMVGSDVVIGWIDANGSPVLGDRRIYEKGPVPPLDQKQNWNLVSGSFQQENLTTVLEFKRHFKTCDTVGDVEIREGPTKVIFSYSDVKPSDPNDISMHVERGSSQIVFIGTEVNNTLPPVEEYEIRVSNITIPSSDTTYWCSIFKLPELQSTAHIIEYRPVLDNVARVHHLLIYDCVSQPEYINEDCNLVPSSVYQMCRSISYGWGIGGSGFILPNDTGVPIGPKFTKYVMMQIHYDNPNQVAGEIDSSGVKIYYTSELRKHDVGVIMIGKDEPLIQIPPAVESFKVVAECPSNCTSFSWDSQGINVIGVLLHTHLLGRQIWTQVIRDGVELSPLGYLEYYDFNFQQIQTFSTPYKLFPKDRLITHCVYNSMDRTNYTNGGPGTHDEMCYNFVFYYPRQATTVCVDVSVPNSPNKGTVCDSKDNFQLVSPQTDPYSPLPPYVPICRIDVGDEGSVSFEKESGVSGNKAVVVVFSLGIGLTIVGMVGVLFAWRKFQSKNPEKYTLLLE